MPAEQLTARLKAGAAGVLYRVCSFEEKYCRTEKKLYLCTVNSGLGNEYFGI